MKLIDYRKIAKQVEADLRAALAKHGLTLKPFGARIEERLGLVRMSLECVDANLKAADGSKTTPEAEYWKAAASLYELDPKWLGEEFTSNRRLYRVVGLLRGRKTKVVQLEHVETGKTYVTTAEDVIRAFAVKKTGGADRLGVGRQTA